MPNSMRNKVKGLYSSPPSLEQILWSVLVVFQLWLWRLFDIVNGLWFVFYEIKPRESRIAIREVNVPFIPICGWCWWWTPNFKIDHPKRCCIWNEWCGKWEFMKFAQTTSKLEVFIHDFGITMIEYRFYRNFLCMTKSIVPNGKWRSYRSYMTCRRHIWILMYRLNARHRICSFTNSIEWKCMTWRL